MITAFFGLLASTTFILTFTIGVLILMAILLEYEKEGWATSLFSLGIALVIWNFKMDIWTYVSSNPTATIGFISSYVLIGIVWSFLKWRTYVKSIFDRAKEIKELFVKFNGDITDTNRSSFNDRISKANFKDGDGDNISVGRDDSFDVIANKIAPQASKKKAIITSWISYWPVSLAGTLLNNPFRKFFEFIYSNLSGFYDKITNTYKKDAFGQ